ncbi:amidohydrolase [Aeromonas sp. FDAARGOS 1415]|uniref:amidohydrolase n=1 Tax=Aeromonas TaxID=642 RepID=UPI001C23A975|nr:amidohydrolase [Aeromonas sp. FDAARGOS 1415]QXB54280.1 amidohydrolase [Aeromonas sp. FDAARGOS 1415]
MTQDALRHWRRDLHRLPEAAWCEFRTSTLIAHHLNELGFSVMLGDQLLASNLIMGREIDVDAEKKRALRQGAHPDWLARIDELTGVMGLWDSGRPGPTLAFRFDIDAVEVQESEEAAHLPSQEGWHSTNPGWMHACAHDGHTAIGLVLAERIAAQGDKLTGRIKLFFQPAEEGCRGGKALAAGGQLDDVDALLALHIGIHANSGELVVNPTEFLCSTKFDVEFMGQAAHAGLEPNAGHNALAAACMATTAMLGIPRHRDGMTRINVGQLHGGSGRNVIPGHARLMGETRGATPALNDYMFNQVQQIVEGAALMQGATYLIRKQGEATGIENSPALIEELVPLAQGIALETIHSRRFGASEDASFLIERVQQSGGQAAYLILGANLAAPHHHPEFDFDESVLAPGVALLEAWMLHRLGR